MNTVADSPPIEAGSGVVSTGSGTLGRSVTTGRVTGAGSSSSITSIFEGGVLSTGGAVTTGFGSYLGSGLGAVTTGLGSGLGSGLVSRNVGFGFEATFTGVFFTGAGSTAGGSGFFGSSLTTGAGGA